MNMIKYRALAKDGTWRYGEYPCLNVDIGNTRYPMDVFWNNFLSTFRRETLGQWTSRKDKNGTEVYDGDIVREYYKIKNKHTGEIKELDFYILVNWGEYHNDEYDWSTNCWLLDDSPMPIELIELVEYRNPYWDLIEGKWEVAGNKWQNPELMEQKNG
jgi:uncharacterized phage protein (TIGR01671 family)